MAANDHIVEYLNYYARLDSAPQFSVLLTGPWGIGKTFLLDRVKREWEKAKVKSVYVSLYGASNVEDIDDSLFRAIYPWADNRGAKIAGRFAKAASKYFGVDGLLKKDDLFLEKTSPDVFVFDDLERCGMGINDVLGYINNIVEHDGKKVVMIANESEIKDNVTYIRIKEKLIGKTFEVQSSLSEALDLFVDSVNSRAVAEFLKLNRCNLEDIYRRSGLNNLRVLRQSIMDFERFYVGISDSYTNNKEAVACLMKILMAFGLELRAGRILEKDLRGRRQKLFRYNTGKTDAEDVPGIAMAQNRYPEIDLTDSVLSDDTLVDVLVKGIVDRTKISFDLDQSVFFVRYEEEPSWKKVWHFRDRTENEVISAISDLEQKFKEREYLVPGELLQIIGIRIFLARTGELGGDVKEVVESCKAYIDDVKERLSPSFGDEEDDWLDMQRGFSGLSYYSSDDQDFLMLRKQLQETWVDAKVRKYPCIAKELMTMLGCDAVKFCSCMAWSSGSDNRYVDIPVLSYVPIDDFVETLLSLHPREQRSVLASLRARYEHGQLAAALQAEHDWIKGVLDALLNAVDGYSAMGRQRVRDLLVPIDRLIRENETQ